jgi:acetyl esterase/lipase
MNRIFIALLLLVMIQDVNAQQVFNIYDSEIPGAKPTPTNYVEETYLLKDSIARTKNVSVPQLTVYRPEKPNGTAVIICPGGGYAILAMDKEGHHVAKKFQAMGVTAFVLKYRLPSDLIMEDKSIGPMQDAFQAIYWVRKYASNWAINPAKVGIMGFSAGGHLAASASVHYADFKLPTRTENISLRPDFSVLIYPVISMGVYTHAGSLKNLLGDKPSDAQRAYFSSELQVSASTPPGFLVHANNDKTVPVQNSLLYNEVLVRYGIAAELHVYQAGGHGFGLHNNTTSTDWFEQLKNWLQQNKL